MVGDCESEILELHRFFQAWFRGELEDTPDGVARLADVLSERFLLVSTGGERMDRRSTLDAVRRAYASRPVSFEIEIRRMEGRLREGGLCLMSYEEWQMVEGTPQGRLSSALFRERSDAPNGVEWIHVHETWLPPSAAGRGPGGAA